MSILTLSEDLVARTAGHAWDEVVASVMEDSRGRSSQEKAPDGRSEPSEGPDDDADELA